MTSKQAKMNDHSAGKPARRPVHFEFDAPTARRVYIAGTFNDWQPETTQMTWLGAGKWVTDLELTPGTYEYRFVIDGKWTTDPHCARTVPNAFGETNSLLVVPEQKATSRPAAGKPVRSAVSRL